MLLQHPNMGKIFGGCASVCSFFAALPYLWSNPFAALLGSIALIGSGYALVDFTIPAKHRKQPAVGGSMQRARWAAITMSITVGFSFIMADRMPPSISNVTIAASALIAQILFIQCAWKQKSGKPRVIFITFGLFLAGLLIISVYMGHTAAIALTFALLTIFLFSRSMPMQERREHWWETLLNHPARLLLSTFFFLCFSGTLFLIIPDAARQGEIALVDAAFTSVSAVCVTGLIVLDTPVAFTLLGQALILLLIQLGGLGIMSIAAVALHAMGRRLSLRHERLLTSMADTDHKDLLDALSRILKFTFFAEGAGALILAGLFLYSGDAFRQAAWRGLFTAVSAFCNAGFSLQSNSLVPYRNSPLVLHTVAALIIFGGMAPATSLVFPRWLMARRIPIAPRIALITTAVMLLSGMFFMLAFEWNGVLSGLSIADKIHNAWFQSATLRTAGFNTVDMAGVISPTFLVMILFMFIGGSPGGTAGGVKTTTIGILAMTFWANITNRNGVIYKDRWVPSATIYRAITIVASVAVVWFAVVLMLEVTQQIPGRDIIFEVTSAIATVGLSTGATARLDEIGKVIIMLAMFAGRIGPMTLFMLLSENISVPVSRCPDAKITLT
ncbi:MAG TPA: potassium transporter TrkH [Deltaproteobacteria bacterium]|nr:potassium transporter TrkH [Deltaproteobacteria bacterium]HIJ41772.1 potassium transporter TrkH [Deltaproteobacteria bacterium]